MTDPFFDILLESWVIVDNKEATVYLPRFIDDNSRLEQNIEKRIRHALENVPALDSSMRDCGPNEDRHHFQKPADKKNYL